MAMKSIWLKYNLQSNNQILVCVFIDLTLCGLEKIQNKFELLHPVLVF